MNSKSKSDLDYKTTVCSHFFSFLKKPKDQKKPQSPVAEKATPPSAVLLRAAPYCLMYADVRNFSNDVIYLF